MEFTDPFCGRNGKEECRLHGQAASGLPDLVAHMGLDIRTSELLAGPMMVPSGIAAVEASGPPSETA